MYNRIDIHAHVNFADFDVDQGAVIDRALQNGTAIINVGSDYDNSKAAVDLAEKYDDGVYAIVGQHPINFETESSSFLVADDIPHTSPNRSTPLRLVGGSVGSSTEDDFANKFRELLTHPKVVGIGECGLDYFRLPPDSAAKQKEMFLAQIALANETKKPLMLHIRQAYDDALDILLANAKVGGNAHFFAGNLEQARRFLDLGFTLSFTGVITFTRDYDELVRFTPLDMIQAETDSPFVAPVPYRGKRNEPAYVAEVVKKIVEIKKIPLDQVEKVLMNNAKRIWGVL